MMVRSDKKGSTNIIKYFIYILRCTDGSLYTGITNDPVKRLLMHQSGKGGKYTRTHPPVSMVYKEECSTKGDALRREMAIKKMTRKAKLALIGSVP